MDSSYLNAANAEPSISRRFTCCTDKYAAMTKDEAQREYWIFCEAIKARSQSYCWRKRRLRQKEDILCQIETGQAQRIRVRNQDRDQDRGAEKGMAPVVEKGPKAAEVARGPVAAEAWAAARGQTSKTLRITKTNSTVKKETPLRVHRDSSGAGVKKGGTRKKF